MYGKQEENNQLKDGFLMLGFNQKVGIWVLLGNIGSGNIFLVRLFLRLKRDDKAEGKKDVMKIVRKNGACARQCCGSGSVGCVFFGPPGSGSKVQSTDPDPSITKQK
jgi:hypothetical protein